MSNNKNIRTRIAGVAVASALGLSMATSAQAAVPHTVQPGETLWSIASASNFTTRTVAIFNGLPEDAVVVPGQTVRIPSVAEGTVALQNAGITPDTSASTASDSSSSSPTSSTSSTAGLGHVPSPYGELHLDPGAAESWNALRQESLNRSGQDIYPAGQVSALRTYDQQNEMYEDYLNGTASLAAPPGTSAHEIGRSVDLQTPEMRVVIDEIGGAFSWGKTEAFGEWWHVNYTGP